MVEQVTDRFGNGTIAIFYFIVNIMERSLGFRRRHSLIHTEPLAHIIDVVLRDPYIDSDVDCGRRIVFDWLTLELPDGTLEHLSVEIKTDSVYVARLLSAQ